MTYYANKNGKPVKPGWLSGIWTTMRSYITNRVAYVFAITLVVVSCIVSYYLFLDNLYVVDEVYDGGGPRELSRNEKITIRVLAPVHSKDLNSFVLAYSVCPVVEEIQVLWNNLDPYPSDSSFKYPHTHSKVTFQSDPTSFSTSTGSIMLLDADVFVSCADLRFTQTVWRTGPDALVGYFPRLHGRGESAVLDYHVNKGDGAAGSQSQQITGLQFLGLGDVLRASSYSIMLAAAVMLKTEYVQEFHQSAVAAELLRRRPECFSIALPLFAAHLKAPAPIFVDVPVTLAAGVRLSPYSSVLDTLSAKRGAGAEAKKEEPPRHLKRGAAPQLTGEQRTQCMLAAMSALQLVHVPVAQHKAVRAESQWWW